MAYICQQEIEDELGGHAKLVEFLDDVGGGVIPAGAVERLVVRASAAVDAFLQGRYVTPLSPVPALAVEAAIVFACEILLNRRRQTLDEKNPYTARADLFRAQLKRISDREESLNAQERPAFAPGAVISERSNLQGSSL